MAVRNADDILIGGGRVFIVTPSTGTGSTPTYTELGYLQGEIKSEVQGSSKAVKESEGGTVLTIATDTETHFTFNLLEANLDTLKALYPSSGELNEANSGTGFAIGTFQADTTSQFEFWHKKRSGKFRCFRIFKGKVSGAFTPLIINQDNETPIPMDIVALADDTKPTSQNLAEIFDTTADNAPGGGW